MSETFNLISCVTIEQVELDEFLTKCGFKRVTSASMADNLLYEKMEGDSSIEVGVYNDFYDDPFLDLDDSEQKNDIENIKSILGGELRTTLAIDYNNGDSTESLYFELAYKFAQKWRAVFDTSVNTYNYLDIKEKCKQLGIY